MSWLMKENELLKLEVENLNNELNLIKNNKIYNNFDYLEENIFHDNTFKKYIRKLFFDKDKFFGNNIISGPFRYEVYNKYRDNNSEYFKDEYYFFKFSGYENYINHKKYEFEISSIIDTREFEPCYLFQNPNSYIDYPNYKNVDMNNFSLLYYILLLFASKKKNLENLFNVEINITIKKTHENQRTICIINKDLQNDWRNIIEKFINVKFEIYKELNKLMEKDKKNSNILKNAFECKKKYINMKQYKKKYGNYFDIDDDDTIGEDQKKKFLKYLKYSNLLLSPEMK
jgi:hypothetical protein